MRHRKTNACDISPKVRRIVEERDNGICILCHQQRGAPNAHFISRAQGGLGIPENIVSLCQKCHDEYDHGDQRGTIGGIIMAYLESHYPGFRNEDRIYDKWRNYPRKEKP